MAHAEEQHSHKIRYCYQNPLSAKELSPTQPDALYECIYEVAGGRTASFSVKFEALKPVIVYKGLNSEKLDVPNVGKVGVYLKDFNFKSPYADASDAIDFLRCDCLHSGRYVRPTKEQLLDYAAKALADMRCPILLGFDKHSVATIFSEFYREKDAVEQLNTRIAALSGGKVKLSVGNPKHFQAVRGEATYLYLDNSEKQTRQYVTFGPYVTPLTCVSFSQSTTDKAGH